MHKRIVGPLIELIGFIYTLNQVQQNSWDKALYENQETSSVILSSVVSFSLK